jgi:uncharacterized glyoxalase superfamily protein PhnB
MKQNRSIPAATVIPVLVYPDVRAAVDWITEAFGFRERLQIGEGHRSQLSYGNGAVILAEDSHGRQAPSAGDLAHSVTVRVENAQSHFEHAREAGAIITAEPTDMIFGERQYHAVDPWGHGWTFSESIADTAPEDWGGISR